MPSQQKPLHKSVSVHAFSPDAKKCVVSPNNDTVCIYSTNGKEDPKDWKLEQSLTEHGGYVSGIDWCEKSNLFVTCGHDRNAYVWKLEGSEWKPTLVILRINRAATSVKWSPSGDKFAVTSGAKCVPVCHFEESQNWWISKMIKKHKSTVLCLDWSPNNKYVVTGACDFKCRIFSAYIEGVDKADDDGMSSQWPKQHEFGEQLAEYDHAKAWVQGVSWSPNGQAISYVGHGSNLAVVHFDGEQANYFIKGLPYEHVFFVDDKTLIAIGFDRNPTVWENKGSASSPNWTEGKKLDPETDEEKKAGGNSAMARFKAADSRGVGVNSGAKAPAIKTFHKNNIVDVKRVAGKKEFTTSGVDGRILRWKV